MSTVSFSSTSVNVSLQTIWEVLLDSIKHPERYYPNVQESKILEQSDKEIVRAMKTSYGETTERIFIDSKNSEIKFKLVQHPEFTGTFIHRVTPPVQKNGLLMLTFIRDWRPKRGRTKRKMPSLREAVMNTKRFAEKWS